MSLINKAHVKRFALETAEEYRGGRFTRVSGKFLEAIDAKVKETVRQHVRSLPSVGKTIFGLLLALTVAAPAFAAEIRADHAVRAIIGEAADQGYEGMYAVACAIRNRGTLQGVYGLNAPHVKRANGYTWQLASKAWAMSEEGPDITGGATHWENVRAFGVPRWARSKRKTLEFRDHVFYR